MSRPREIAGRTNASSADAAAPVSAVNEKLYRDLIDNSLGLICSHDLDGKLLMINRAAAEALGYKREELEGKNFRDFIDPSLRVSFDQYIAHIAREGAAHGYLRLNTRSGEKVTWIYRNKLYQDAESPPVILGHAQDVTWRLKMEQRLRETTDNYVRLFEDAPVAYHEIDRNGMLLKLNRADCELFGCEKQHAVGRPVWELVVPEMQEESRRSVLRKLSGEQPLIPFFREFLRADGRRILAHVHENLILSASGEILGIRTAILDVTEQKRTELELRRLNLELDQRVAERTAELDRSHKRMREFVYTVSHDLQEPLRSIGSFAKLLRDRYADRLDADGMQFLEYVTSGTVRMAKLVSDLLAYSRVLHDHADSLEIVPLKEAVNIAAENLSRSIRLSGAVITCGDLPAVETSPHRLVQLLQNLIGNSIKYKGQDSPRIQIDARQEGAMWHISVQDNGVGIQEQDRKRIFGLFKRTQPGVASGSGVGLAICHAIVERHGGRIWMEPAAGGGSVFTFTLPCTALKGN